MKLATFRSSSTTRMRIRSVVHHPLRPVNAAHAILGAVVLDLSHLFQHFGYAAILVVVLLDNVGFWLGRYYGQRVIARLPLPPARLDQAQRMITRYGARAVFLSRFVAGLRTVAGPLAGAGGLSPVRFFVANLLGAICYVPWPVLAGFGIGYGLEGYIEKLRAKLGLKEDLALFAAVLAMAGACIVIRAWFRDRRGERPAVS